ncbi:MAG: HD domain-containing protein [bacterium]
MRKITEIYKDYKIMPQLAMHQLRVTAVAFAVCDSIGAEVDKESIIKACLLHDMANLIKFNLELFPEFNQPEGIDYWKIEQAKQRQMYGTDEHAGSITIARALGASDEVLSNIHAIDFHNWDNVYKNGTLENKISVYADSRVAPQGVVSLNSRIEEGSKRYEGLHPEIDAKRNILHDAIRAIEVEIFTQSSIKPEDITEESVTAIIESLKNYEI